MPDLQDLQAQLGYTFRDERMLRLALTHPSVAHEQDVPVQHNQRLEFLGDSVLGLVLTRELYLRFPDCGEGSLTKARAHLVNRRSLSEQAARMSLGEVVLLSRGEETSGGRSRPSIQADAFEALIGAIFLDGGLDPAAEFILKMFQPTLETLILEPGLGNPKGELQERLQAASLESPRYQLVAVAGPDHDRVFESAVLHGGVELGRGTGKSKKAAETEAAVAALEKLRAREKDEKPESPA